MRPVTTSTPPPRKHLMVPGQPRPVRRHSNIERVQRIILSSLAFITIEHLALGIALVAITADHATNGVKIGLLVVATMFGFVAVTVALLIHRRSPLSPWLVFGLLPGLIGAYFTHWG